MLFIMFFQYDVENPNFQLVIKHEYILLEEKTQDCSL